jgi:hypothetical protein
MLRKWFNENKLFTNKQNKERPATHYLLDKGCVHIPFEKQNDFFRVYVEALSKGEKLYLVEKKTDLFRLFIDLDMEEEDPVDLSRVEEYVAKIQEVVAEFYPNLIGNDRRVVICMRDPQKQQGEVISPQGRNLS